MITEPPTWLRDLNFASSGPHVVATPVNSWVHPRFKNIAKLSRSDEKPYKLSSLPCTYIYGLKDGVYHFGGVAIFP